MNSNEPIIDETTKPTASVPVPDKKIATDIPVKKDDVKTGGK